ncbi:phytanoyl-CoA dioxygenase [Sphingomonas sp. DBB INV C78]|uniref:phytanoyl-CoA dioxygenase family protein n=1 Tax=Sphingomonas sp. DBB INV C78 TaxID=3349434 RepID=UPI0036D22DFE
MDDRAALRDVTDEEIATFWRDGVVCLRAIMPPAWLEVLAEGVERYLASDAAFSLSAFGAERPETGKRKPKAHFYGGTDHWKVDEACRRFACESPLPAIAGQLLRASRINLYEDSILVKEPGAIEKTAFHQDLSYFHVEGSQICTTWVPLDPVKRETGALQFVRGSHLSRKLFRPNFFVSTDAMPDTEGEIVPDLHADRRDAEILCFDTEPGDITIHHARTLHGADGNHSATMRRRAMSVRYCGDDARYKLRRGAPRKPHHEEVAEGAVLDHADCPVVWMA